MDRMSRLVALVILTGLFAYLITVILRVLSPVAIIVAWLLLIPIVVVFYIAMLLLIVWLFLLLTDWLHFYRIRREHREIKLEKHRKQLRLPVRNRIPLYRYLYLRRKRNARRRKLNK